MKIPRRAWLVLILMGFTLFGMREAGVRRDLLRWKQYQQQAAAKGDDLGVDAWQPPRVENPADDFAAQPWLVELWADDKSPASRQLQALNEALVKVGVLAKSGPPFGGDRGKAQAFLAEIQPLEGALTAFREAAARPGCDLSFRRELAPRGDSPSADDEDRLEDFYESEAKAQRIIATLTTLSGCLSSHAQAALEAGDEETAVADLEALFRAAAHLSALRERSLLECAATMDTAAQEVVQRRLENGGWSPAARQRLLAAMPGRPIAAEDLFNAMRLMRGRLLRSVDVRQQEQPLFVTGSWGFAKQWLYPAERIAALNKRFICAATDTLLHSHGAQIERDEGTAETYFDERENNPLRWSEAAISRHTGVYLELLRAGEKVAATREELLAAPER